MKKTLIGLTVLAVITAGTMAFAGGPGWGGGYGGCDGPGYGPAAGYCDGPGYGRGDGARYGRGGYGRGMMRGGGGWMMDFRGSEEGEKFLEETADMRRELHQKRFEYFELLRDKDADEQTVAALEKEIDGLRDKIQEQAPERGFRGYGRRGACW